MKAAVLMVVTVTAAAQTINPSPQSLIGQKRALLPAEIAQVLAAARHALDGQKFRLAYVAGGPGIDVIAGPNGWPRWKQSTHGVESSSSVAGSSNGVSWSQQTREHFDLITIVEYTDTAARSCDGKPLDGNLIVEYERKTPPGTWTAKARTRSAVEELSPLFDTLSDDTLSSSGELRTVNGRTARAFTAPYKVPASSGVVTFSAPPSAITKTLWLDVESLLPLRWAVSVPAQANMPPLPDYGLSFSYDASIDISAPDGVPVPTCVR